MDRSLSADRSPKHPWAKRGRRSGGRRRYCILFNVKLKYKSRSGGRQRYYILYYVKYNYKSMSGGRWTYCILYNVKLK